MSIPAHFIFTSGQYKCAGVVIFCREKTKVASPKALCKNPYKYLHMNDPQNLFEAIRSDFFYIEYFVNRKSRTPLKKHGKGFITLCIYHNERSPSFTITKKDGRWMYKCFGCGKSGDVFTIVMHTDRATFGQAVQIISAVKKPVHGGGGSLGSPDKNQGTLF